LLYSRSDLMVNTSDVVIVGAGPAGVSAAISAANQGLNVILIDAKSKERIGDKVCGEALSKKTVLKVSKMLDIDPPREEEINAKIETMVVRTGNPEINIELPAIGFMINRHIYGQRLLKEALSRNVKLVDNCKVTTPIIEKGRVVGVIAKKADKEEEFRAKITIDASGCRAVIRTNLPEDFSPRLYKKLTKNDYASCFREIIELKEDHDLHGKIVLQYEKDIPEPGYIWFFGDGKQKLNCGTGFQKIGKNEQLSVKQVYFNAMEKYYSNYNVIDGRGDVVPVQPPLWNAVAPGLIVVGDAAFHADPLTAEGHGPALLAGTIAGKVAKQAIEKGKYDINNLWQYNVEVMKEFGSDNSLYKILAVVLKRIGAEDLEFLIRKRVIKESDLSVEGLSKKESIFSLLARVIRCFPKIYLLLLMKKALSATKQIKNICSQFPNDYREYENWKRKMELIYQRFI